jgi:pSer/pThr/pTyr-binding forkhead associated (FHA) protein
VPDLHGTRLTFIDLESADGTLLNGEGLVTDQPLAIGDRIEIGETRIIVEAID